jgi:cell fate regulator YaaT (PSP1 superfamily)
VAGLATAQDIALHTENSILAAEAAAFCKTCIRQRGLEMKLITVEVLHDRSKIIFFFTAPSRIDFRELVKDLVRNYRTRIELRQIGVRHETQMTGGIGNCGMVCCCHKYLRKFAPVTIKMAKEQNLFLNPVKLSGMCGRLLCCLSFEQNNYEEFHRRCPKPGKKYATARGTVKVLRANLFSQKICILAENGEEAELSLEEWDALDLRRTEQPSPEPQHPAVPEGKGRGRQREQGGNEENDTAVGGQPSGGFPDPDSGKGAAASEHEPDRQSRQRKRRRRPE